MQSKETEVQSIMQTFNVSRDVALKKLERMIAWATAYKRFADGVLDERELRQRVNEHKDLWNN